MVLKYYIKGSNKSDFYHVGTDIPGLGIFKKGRGWEFITSFYHDFPALLDEVSIINENDEEIEMTEFIKKIAKAEKYDLN